MAGGGTGAPAWLWNRYDKTMLVSEFSDLDVVLQYKLVRRKLRPLGAEAALERLEKVRRCSGALACRQVRNEK